MSTRAALRPLAATPPRGPIELVLGKAPDGTPQANLDDGTYRGKPIALRDPAIVRGLIVDLHLALVYLEAGSHG